MPLIANGLLGINNAGVVVFLFTNFQRELSSGTSSELTVKRRLPFLVHV